MHKSRLNLHKIRCQISVFVIIFHFTDKVIICRVIINYNRSTFGFRIINNKIYSVFKRCIIVFCSAELRQKSRNRILFVRLLLRELVYVFKNILLYRFKIFYNSFTVLIFFLQRTYIMTDCKHTYFVIKIIHLLTVFLINILYITHNRIDNVLHGLKPFVYTVFNVFIKRIIIFLGYKHIIYNRLEYYSRIRGFKCKAVFRCNRIKLFYKLISFIIICT